MTTLNDALQSCSPELQQTITAITNCCVDIATKLKTAPLAGILGSADNTNVQGETQKELDVIANDMIKDALAACPSVRAFTSEEEDEFVLANSGGKHIAHFDPLDGSSNIDINSLVGTIFSIYEAPTKDTLTEHDLLRPGKEQVAAGYALYGPAVTLCLTTGNGTHMYTWAAEQNAFVEFKANVKIAEDTKEFAINMSNQRHWHEGMQDYIADLLAGETGKRDKNFNMRWVAAMVGDVHRVLSRGGVFIYPWDRREPGKAGKLRLMYEANPMSFLVEQAGGKSCTPDGDIMDVQPTAIHQRVPVILGSANEVQQCLDYHKA